MCIEESKNIIPDSSPIKGTEVLKGDVNMKNGYSADSQVFKPEINSTESDNRFENTNKCLEFEEQRSEAETPCENVPVNETNVPLQSTKDKENGTPDQDENDKEMEREPESTGLTVNDKHDEGQATLPNDNEPCDSLFDPTEVLNVEIAPQETCKHTHPTEPCKQVQGEAVERVHNRVPSNSGCLFVDQDDAIETNIQWIDEDDERIDLDYSPPHSPVGSEHSLFPPPQMNYHSIYSQETVSLSEISFSEPEHDAPPSCSIRKHDYKESLATLSIESSELTDIEDNRCHTPPVNLDSDGGMELTEASLLQHKYDSTKGSAKGSTCSTPSILDIDSPIPMSPHSMAEKVSERLRLLADSWADIPVPNCGSIQSIAVTDTLVWCISNQEHLFVTPSASANVNWKKVDGKALQISANQSGTIIWGVNRKKVASYRTNVRQNNPQGKH